MFDVAIRFSVAGAGQAAQAVAGTFDQRGEWRLQAEANRANGYQNPP